MARLQHGAKARCITIEAPAGSGRTQLLLQWRRSLLESGVEVAWLALDETDARPADLLARLQACLRDAGALSTPATIAALAHDSDDGDDGASERLVIALVADLARWPRELVVVVEDLHRLSNDHSLEALRLLLAYSPATVRWCFSSRSPIPASLQSWRGGMHPLQLGPDDLRFSEGETERFLQQRLGGLALRDRQALHALTDGWASGLEQLCSLMRSRRCTRFMSGDPDLVEAVAGYFQREVLSELTAQDREILVHGALCATPCAELCAALLGPAQSAGWVATRLAAMARRQLFVRRLETPDKAYRVRMQPLLREVLLAELQTLPTARLQSLHRTAWRWHAARGEVDDAVRHAVQAGDVDDAADLVEKQAGRMVTRGALRHLGRLVTQLPDAVLRARVPLRLLVMQLRLYGRQLAALALDIDEFERERPALTGAQRYSLVLLKAGLALQRDELATVAALAPALERPPDGADPLMLVRRGNLLAWLHMHQGQHEAARRLLDDAEQRENSPDRRLVGAALRGLGLLLEGRVGRAESVLRQVAAEAGADAEIDESIGCVAWGLLCDCLYEADDLVGLDALLQERLDVLERSAIPDAVLRALVAKAAAQRLRGAPEEALALVDRLERYAHARGLPRLLLHAVSVRLRWSLEDGAVDHAATLRLRLDTLAVELMSPSEHGAADAGLTVAGIHALASLHWKDLAAASARLVEFKARARALSRWREVAVAEAMQAVADLARGWKPSAREHLVAALKMAHRLGLVRSLLDVSDRIPGMVEDLLKTGELDEVLAFHAKRLLAVAQRRKASGEAAGRPSTEDGGDAWAPFSIREREVLDLMAQAMPNKRIALVLGITTHTVKFHLSRIYAKLGVTERQQALARCRSLKSLQGSRTRVEGNAGAGRA